MIGSADDQITRARRATRSFDRHEVVCLGPKILQPLSFHNSGLNQALEPEDGRVGFLDDNPDLRDKLGFGSGAARSPIVRAYGGAGPAATVCREPAPP